MQEHDKKKYVDGEMKQVEIPKEVHKALKLEAADRDMPMKNLAADILEGWLDGNRPEWKSENKDENGVWNGEERRS